MTPALLFGVMVRAVRRKDRSMRQLLYQRPGYQHYVPGIATTYETGAVYAIFKDLVRLLPPGWVPEWEFAHGVGHKKIDLLVRRSRGPLWHWGIEVKWWTKGGYGIAIDCAKLLQAAHLDRRFVLVLATRPTPSRWWPLERLLDRSITSGRLSAFHVDVINRHALNVVAQAGENAMLDMALLEIRKSSRAGS